MCFWTVSLFTPCSLLACDVLLGECLPTFRRFVLPSSLFSTVWTWRLGKPILPNVRIYGPKDTASHSRRLESSVRPLRGPQRLQSRSGDSLPCEREMFIRVSTMVHNPVHSPQDSTSDLYLDPHKSSARPHVPHLKMHLHIIFPSTPSSYNLTLFSYSYSTRLSLFRYFILSQPADGELLRNLYGVLGGVKYKPLRRIYRRLKSCAHFWRKY
jgi:hypothetical protein